LIIVDIFANFADHLATGYHCIAETTYETGYSK
jgi:hypothetical protein